MASGPSLLSNKNTIRFPHKKKTNKQTNHSAGWSNLTEEKLAGVDQAVRPHACSAHQAVMSRVCYPRSTAVKPVAAAVLGEALQVLPHLFIGM